MKTAFVNLLEAATVSLAAGAEDPSYPLYRLSDRNVGRLFKPAAAVTIEIKVDQGAGGTQAIDRLIIPSGHNLDGETLDIKHSTDDIVYTPAVAQWVQSGSELIDKSWGALTKRYWKFFITTPSAIPEIAELFLTETYTWARNPQRPGPSMDKSHNVKRDMTVSGQDRFLVNGDPKRRRPYKVPRMPEAMKGELIALNDAWAGAYPFWLYDHEGSWIYGKLASRMDVREVASGQWSLNFDFMEVLP